MQCLQGAWTGVLRSKGFFWLATRMDWAGSLSQAGTTCRTEAAGFWWTAVDKNQWPEDEDQCREIAKLWQEPYGDRRQEIVIIGQDLDRDAISARLDACLLTDTEMALGPEGWLARFPDPFLEWRLASEAEAGSDAVSR